jgi:uncharacterized NAD(P)/FAD-binding protein YdhS
MRAKDKECNWLFMNKSYAIIGLGFCGILSLHRLVFQLDRSKRQNLNIEVFAPDGINPPVHYNNSNDDFILNVPASSMSAFPEDKDHFYRWLVKNNYYFNKKFNKDSFVPRKLYGHYLMDIFKDAINTAKNKGININFHFNKVDDIVKTDIGFICKTDIGHAVLVEKVIVAIGPQYKEMNNTAEHSEAFSEIKMNQSKYQKIAIIGSSLSAVDVICGLKTSGYKGEINVFSQSKTFPSVRADNDSYKNIESILKPGDSLKSCISKIKKFLSKNKDYDIRHVISSIRSVTKDIWSHFDDYDKSIFARKLMRYWNKNRHCMPQESYNIISSAIKSRYIKMHGHNVNYVKKSGKKFTVNTANKNFEKFDIVINCIGFDMSFKNSRLVQNMSKNGIAKYDIFGAKSLENNLIFLGALNVGRYIESTAVSELSMQVMDIFVKKMESNLKCTI